LKERKLLLAANRGGQVMVTQMLNGGKRQAHMLAQLINRYYVGMAELSDTRDLQAKPLAPPLVGYVGQQFQRHRPPGIPI
jgi:hypothetical protein